MALPESGFRTLAGVGVAFVFLGILFTWGPRWASSGEAPPAAAPQGFAACPSEDFREFLSAFSESASVQETFTRMPLRRSHIDPSASPEPARVEQIVGRAEITFPIFPNAAERARRKLEYDVEAATGASKRLKLFVPDTGEQTLFIFVWNGCWQLVEIEDQSI